MDRYAARMITPRILWGALLASTGIYLVILQTLELAPGEPDPMMLPALAIAGAFSAITSIAWPAYAQRQAAASATFEIEEVPDPNAQGMFRDQVPTLRRFADPDAVVSKGMALFFTPYILAMALAESVAIYGFVLGFLGFDLVTIIPFWVVAWALMLVRFPRWSDVIAPLEKAHDTSFVPPDHRG